MKFRAHFGGLLPLLAGGFLAAGPALAQQVVSARAGLIYVVVGEVSVESGRVPATFDPAVSREVRAGQTLRTEEGLAEVLLGPAVFFRMDESGSFRMLDDSLANSHVRLERGAAIVEVVSKDDDIRTWVHVADTVTLLQKTGLYRFEVARETERDALAELRVHRGEAQVWRDETKAPLKVKRGQAVDLREEELATTDFDTKSADYFHQWAAMRSFTLFMIDGGVRDARNHWYARNSLEVWSDAYEMAFPGRLVKALPDSSVQFLDFVTQRDKAAAESLSRAQQGTGAPQPPTWPAPAAK